MSKHICTRWAFDLSTWTPTLPQLTQAVAAIQPEERTRLLKFHFIEDFLSSLIGRLLMRKYVSTCSGLPYQQVQFARDVRGKPYWVKGKGQDQTSPAPPLSFNVSHQGSLVLLAGITTDNANSDFGIGTDVMKVEYGGGKPLSEFFRLMQSKFSAHEWSYIGRPQHNERAQLKAFMRHWCLKEAYVKELGVGITIDLEKISFAVDTTHPLEEAASPLCGTTLRFNDTPMTNWHFEEHLLSQKYCAAIAFRNCQPHEKAKFKILQFEDLIVRCEEAAEQPDVVAYCKEALQKPQKR
ncbi:L-aminoadipate-semialdehyde dehydrogenase-phosphopantetheinyl transferase [Scaptodrosophila lebanonensis]|uniref:L-aminoadipate-semialdehyde dehydrogenase-phosphopantetheinyl transferase n=1 Tax=Drosophila lebanonensis TaxID=7225 RepID=A0A6J2UB81_DROLE|nr:L-aminoadipate-semialdehyde dehydrogenase-phosphopantetheinyl transferase [Scaptodrosophila lebanonensis]